MQKVIEVGGRKVHLRPTMSPSLAVELQVFAANDYTLALSAAIGLVVASGTGVKLAGVPAKSLYAYSREINDALLGAGWSFAEVLQLGLACLAHAGELVPVGAFPSADEVEASMRPTSAPEPVQTDRG